MDQGPRAGTAESGIDEAVVLVVEVVVMVMVGDGEAGDEVVVGGVYRRGRKNEGWTASAPWNGSSTRPGAVCFVSSRRACCEY